MMRRANYLFETTKGSTIFQNPKNGLFGIQQLFRLLELDADRLFAEVEAMAKLAEDWKQILEGCSQVEAELKARKAESPATEPSGLGSSGIMRI